MNHQTRRVFRIGPRRIVGQRVRTISRPADYSANFYFRLFPL
jgi:hypothetical protein